MIDGMDYPEGAAPLDPDELEGLKYSHVTTRAELDELEAVNMSDGLRWLGRQRNPHILTGEFVRELHRRLFGDVWIWAGQYRRTEKNIGIDPIHISVRLHDLLDDAKYWVEHETYDPIEAAVRLHHRLVFIHPFPNGNGRHARIMADTMLQSAYGRDPLDWAGGYDLMKDNKGRKEYISALRFADGGDYKPLLSFVGVHQGQ
jgi:Fic-DOC domain mobile mystery protein B